MAHLDTDPKTTLARIEHRIIKTEMRITKLRIHLEKMKITSVDATLADEVLAGLTAALERMYQYRKLWFEQRRLI